MPTHFGAVEDPGAHLAALREALRVEDGLAARMDRASYTTDLERRIRERLAEEGLDGETFVELDQAAPFENQWPGLDRHRRKREENRD